MGTTFTKKQFDNICKDFFKEVESYEKVKKSELEIEVFNGFITLTITGKFYEYSEVIDSYDDNKVKGFQLNPISK